MFVFFYWTLKKHSFSRINPIHERCEYNSTPIAMKIIKNKTVSGKSVVFYFLILKSRPFNVISFLSHSRYYNITTNISRSETHQKKKIHKISVKWERHSNPWTGYNYILKCRYYFQYSFKVSLILFGNHFQEHFNILITAH